MYKEPRDNGIKRHSILTSNFRIKRHSILTSNFSQRNSHTYFMTYLDCMNHLTEKKLGLKTSVTINPNWCDLCSENSSALKHQHLNEAFDSDVIVNSSTLYDIISRHQSPLTLIDVIYVLPWALKFSSHLTFEE